MAAPSAAALPRQPLRALLTGVVVFGPLVALGGTIGGLWGRGVSARDLVIGGVMYAVVGHGVTIGYHRLFAHRSFRANRPLRIVLASLGSLSFEGGVIGWVANHRCHHAHTDAPGDPHSPAEGFWHAHLGWMFRPPEVSIRRYARDLLVDRDLRLIDRLFPVACVVTFAIPFGLGWLLGGTVTAALSSLLWAGVVRICLQHHVTWSINSICHSFGDRPFVTGDRSTNVAVLAALSLGESWHNAHHAFPHSSRHGVDRHQPDTSAAIIRLLERAGWATDVRRPDAGMLAAKRRMPALA